MKFKSAFTFVVLISLTGCFFESISDNLSLCSECQGSPLATADNATKLYRAMGTRPAGTPIYLVETDLSGNTTTRAGNGSAAVVDGVGLAAGFREIKALLVKPGTINTIYIADECTIREVNGSTWQVTTIAGLAGTCTDADGTGTNARFTSISDLLLIGNELYIGTQTSIRKLNLSTMAVTTFAGTLNSTGYTDAVGTAAMFRTVAGMALVGNEIFVLDSGNFRIRKVNLVTANVSTVAGNGTEGIIDGIGTAAQVGIKIGNKITSDGSDFLFFTDVSSIRKFQISTNQITTIIGYNPDDQDGNVGVDARIYYPKGIVYSTNGIFVANAYGVGRIY